VEYAVEIDVENAGPHLGREFGEIGLGNAEAAHAARCIDKTVDGAMACEQGMHQLFCFGALVASSMKASTPGGPQPAAAATLRARSRSMSVTAKV
jgi:hypothetical protein